MSEESDAPHARAAHSIQCVTCGYALDGLAEDALCPECATPVASSKQGFLLGDPRWSSTLHVGARLTQIGMIGASLSILIYVSFIITIIISLLLSSGPHSRGLSLALTGWVCFAFIPTLFAVTLIPLGCWLLTAEPPAGAARPRDRMLFRWSTLTIVTVAVGAFVCSMVGGLPRWIDRLNLDTALLLLTGVLVLVSLSAQGSYVADLARLIPDQRIQRRARLMRWLGPVLFVPGGLLLGIGLLLASVLFALLYSRLARVLYDCKEAAWLNSRTSRPPPPVV